MDYPSRYIATILKNEINRLEMLKESYNYQKEEYSKTTYMNHHLSSQINSIEIIIRKMNALIKYLSK